MSASDHLSEGQFEIVASRRSRPDVTRQQFYYHGHGRPGGRIDTGMPEWDNAGLFVSHDPEVAKLYGPEVDRIEMAPDTRVRVHWGEHPKTHSYDYVRRLGEARSAGVDVAEFHRPHDFVGHVILNQGKILSRQPYKPEPERELGQ